MKQGSVAGELRRASPGLARLLLVLLLLGLFLASCRDPSDWYPRGILALQEFYELESDGLKCVYATILISNTGNSVINRSTFGLRAETDSGTYHTTAVSEIRIVPRGAIWTTVIIPYASTAEILAEEGLSVQHGFFE